MPYTVVYLRQVLAQHMESETTQNEKHLLHTGGQKIFCLWPFLWR